MLATDLQPFSMPIPLFTAKIEQKRESPGAYTADNVLRERTTEQAETFGRKTVEATTGAPSKRQRSCRLSSQFWFISRSERNDDTFVRATPFPIRHNNWRVKDSCVVMWWRGCWFRFSRSFSIFSKVVVIISLCQWLRPDWQSGVAAKRTIYFNRPGWSAHQRRAAHAALKASCVLIGEECEST